MTIVIHSPPRTGGFSVRWYCEQSLKFRCHHVHYLANHYYYQNKRPTWNSIRLSGKEKRKVITLVRDPIARNLSEYWRRWYMDRQGTKGSKMRKEQGLFKRKGTHEQRFRAFVDHYRQHYFLGSELIPFWEIDVFAQPFEPPYMIFDDKILLIRCEDLTEYGHQAIYELTDRKSDDPFPHKNVVPTNRENILLDESYLQAMYQDKWFPRFFYSDDEIEVFKEKWTQSTDIG